MIHRLKNIIDIKGFIAIFSTDRSGFENIASLIMSQSATFHMIGVICQLNLKLMVDSAVYMVFLFLS